jgi:hypothetical protein
MFQELFKQHQVQHPVIIINGMKFADVKLVIEFMYRGEIKVWICLSPLCDYKCTDMCCLTMAISSAKCDIRCFRHCANVHLHKPR